MAFQGSLSELPLPDIIQLVSVSGKTGAFHLKRGGEEGQIFLSDGQIVHAEVGHMEGEEAVYELATWNQGDFSFDPGPPTPEKSITKSNTNLLMEAARRMDEWKILAKRIRSTRQVPIPVIDDHNTSVSFTAEEWRVVSMVDGRRSIDELAVALEKSPFDTAKVLFGLVTSKVLDLRDDFVRPHRPRLYSLSVEELAMLCDQIHELAKRRADEHADDPRFEKDAELCRAELSSGRVLDGLEDLIRRHEQTLVAVAGEDARKAFTEDVTVVLSGAQG